MAGAGSRTGPQRGAIPARPGSQAGPVADRPGPAGLGPAGDRRGADRRPGRRHPGAYLAHHRGDRFHRRGRHRGPGRVPVARAAACPRARVPRPAPPAGSAQPAGTAPPAAADGRTPDRPGPGAGRNRRAAARRPARRRAPGGNQTAVQLLPLAPPSANAPDAPWWDSAQAAPPAPSQGAQRAPAPDLSTYLASTFIAQCPRCGAFRLDIRQAGNDWDFRCAACAYTWTWQPGTPWPPVRVMPRGRRE